MYDASGGMYVCVMHLVVCMCVCVMHLVGTH